MHSNTLITTYYFNYYLLLIFWAVTRDPLSDNIQNPFLRPFLYSEKILTVRRNIPPFLDSDKKA